METEKSFSGEEAEKDFCGRLFFLAAIFPFSNEKACLGVIAKTDFFYRLKIPYRKDTEFFHLPCLIRIILKIFESTMQISEAASGHVPSNFPVKDMTRNITPAAAETDACYDEQLV